MPNQLLNMMMNQLKARNPQAFSQLEQLKKNNGNPQEFLNQLTSNYTPEQRQQFMKYANNFGFTNEQLNNFGINAK